MPQLKKGKSPPTKFLTFSLLELSLQPHL